MRFRMVMVAGALLAGLGLTACGGQATTSVEQVAQEAARAHLQSLLEAHQFKNVVVTFEQETETIPLTPSPTSKSAKPSASASPKATKNIPQPTTTMIKYTVLVARVNVDGVSCQLEIEKTLRTPTDTSELYFDEIFLPDGREVEVVGDARRNPTPLNVVEYLRTKHPECLIQP